MADETPPLPLALRKLAGEIGAAAAQRLAEAYGGLEDLYVPMHPRTDHPFVAVIGWDALVRLCALYGGCQIDIPRGVQYGSLKAQIATADGSNGAVARQVGCTQRYVRRIRAEQRAADGSQGRLFDD